MAKSGTDMMRGWVGGEGVERAEGRGLSGVVQVEFSLHQVAESDGGRAVGELGGFLSCIFLGAKWYNDGGCSRRSYLEHHHQIPLTPPSPPGPKPSQRLRNLC